MKSLQEYGAMYGTIWGIGVGLIVLYLVSQVLRPVLAILPDWLLIATGLFLATLAGFAGRKLGIALSHHERNNSAAAKGLVLGILLAIACSVGLRMFAFGSLRGLSSTYVVPMNLILITMFGHVGWIGGGNMGQSQSGVTRRRSSSGTHESDDPAPFADDEPGMPEPNVGSDES